jgi:hypothetical protein
VVILQSAAATILVLATVLILRACWRADQPPVTPMRARPRRVRRNASAMPDIVKRAA